MSTSTTGKENVFKQAERGAIGLKATGSIARVFMDVWLVFFKKRLRENYVKMWLG